MTAIDRIQEADQIIEEVLSTGRPACVTTSFQADGMVLIHLLKRHAPDLPVLFIDTGYHFTETYQYRDRIVKEWNLNLVNLTARQSVAEQESQFGILYSHAPDQCCHMRKVEPLNAGLANYEIWFAALRREQSPTRAGLKIADDFVLPSGKTLIKISPLAAWTQRDVWEYLKSREIPMLPLYERGYQSIGCAPCTNLPLDPDNPRSGRWAGRKLECGIHVTASPAIVAGAANTLVQLQA